VAKQKDETHVVAIALDDHMAYAFFVLVHSLVTTAQLLSI